MNKLGIIIVFFALVAGPAMSPAEAGRTATLAKPTKPTRSMRDYYNCLGENLYESITMGWFNEGVFPELDDIISHCSGGPTKH